MGAIKRNDAYFAIHHWHRVGINASETRSVLSPIRNGTKQHRGKNLHRLVSTMEASGPKQPSTPSTATVEFRALYPQANTRVLCAIDHIDALLDGLPRRWQTQRPDRARTMYFWPGALFRLKLSRNASTWYHEEASKDDRPRRVVLALRDELPTCCIDYAVIVDDAALGAETASAAVDAPQSAPSDAADTYRDAKTPTQGSANVVEPCPVETGCDGGREMRLLKAAFEIATILSGMSINASFVTAPDVLDVVSTHGYVLPIYGNMSNRVVVACAIEHIRTHVEMAKTVHDCAHDVVIYIDAKGDRLFAHVVSALPTIRAKREAETEPFGGSSKTIGQSLCGDAPVAGSAPVKEKNEEPVGQQTLAEIVALYPKLTAAQASKLLSIEGAIGEVDHYWTDSPAKGRLFSVVEPEGASETALVERVRSISATYAKGRRIALTLSDDSHALNVVVPWARSSPKEQTIDDLLDLYPMLTAREAIRLDNVVADLDLIPTVWVDKDSGHGYDNNGIFDSAAKLIDLVDAAYDHAKTKHADCHVVLTLRRLAGESRDLAYYFAVVPTA